MKSRNEQGAILFHAPTYRVFTQLHHRKITSFLHSEKSRYFEGPCEDSQEATQSLETCPDLLPGLKAEVFVSFVNGPLEFGLQRLVEDLAQIEVAKLLAPSHLQG